MIKAKFSFFQMQIKRFLRNTIKLFEPTFCEAPKKFDPINGSATIGELVMAMMHAVVLVISDIYQAVIPTPVIAVNDTGRPDFSVNKALQRLFPGNR